MNTFNDKEVRYLHIAIPYNKEKETITFDDGLMTELSGTALRMFSNIFIR